MRCPSQDHFELQFLICFGEVHYHSGSALVQLFHIVVVHFSMSRSAPDDDVSAPPSLLFRCVSHLALIFFLS